jgi:hypothetical protein
VHVASESSATENMENSLVSLVTAGDTNHFDGATQYDEDAVMQISRCASCCRPNDASRANCPSSLPGRLDPLIMSLVTLERFAQFLRDILLLVHVVPYVVPLEEGVA